MAARRAQHAKKVFQVGVLYRGLQAAMASRIAAIQSRAKEVRDSRSAPLGLANSVFREAPAPRITARLKTITQDLSNLHHYLHDIERLAPPREVGSHSPG